MSYCWGYANPASNPVIQEGSTGSYVKGCQVLLYRAGYNPGPVDGIFGTQTMGTVMEYQSDQGLTVDGIVGPQTWTSLSCDPRWPADRPSISMQTPQYWNPDVQACQYLLQHCGYYHGTVDGIFGPQTEDAVVRFQADYGLIYMGSDGKWHGSYSDVAPGVVGTRTWNVIYQIAFETS